MRGSAWLLLAAALATAPAARADDTATAAEFFRAGSAAFARREYRAAALAYEEADRHAPHPLTICNAALAWDGAGEEARAADGYRAAVERGGLAQPQASHAEKRLAALDAKLGRLRVRSAEPARIAVAHATARPTPAVVHLAPGEYQLRIEHADGKSEERKVNVARAGEEVAIEIAAPERTQAVAPPAPVPPPRADEPRPPPPQGNDGSAMRAAGWIALGVGAIAAGAGLYLGVTGRNARDDYVDSGLTDVDAREEAIDKRTWANVAFAGSLLLGATGVTLLVIGSSKGPPASAVRIHPGRLEVAVRF